MKLSTEESIVTQEGASHFREFVAVGGELVLTNKRLVFNSTSRLSPKSRLEVKLDRIDTIDYFKTLNIYPNGIMLMMKDGTMESFIVDDRKQWKSRIQEYIGQGI